MSGVREVVRALAAVAVAAGLVAGTARAEQADRPIDRTAQVVDSDFDHVNPGIGFGWFGLSDIPIGSGAGDATAVSAPVLGIRWWMGTPLGPFRGWGIDLGLGIARRSTDASPRDVTRTGVLFHAGLPLVVSASRHVAIEFVPELNLGFASGQESDGTDVDGSRVDVGARTGAEVFFGFVGLPQLSLEASVGLFLSRESRTVKLPGQREATIVTTSFGTVHLNDPWDLFRTGVAARYYF